MIKNDFQKVYRKIISQAPIFDTFDDQIIKPRLVKCNNDYYIEKMRDFAKINLDEVVKHIDEKYCTLLYFYINPFSIYDENKSQDFNLFKVKSYDMNKYDTINDYAYQESNTNIALQFSIISLVDISLLHPDDFDPISFRLSEYAKNEEAIADQLNTVTCYYDERLQQLHEEFKEEYINDINKGGIVFIYSIVDISTGKTLYFDHDIFENKKFLTGMIPHTIDYLKAKVKKYFKQKNVFDEIKKVLTNKLIEIKNNY